MSFKLVGKIKEAHGIRGDFYVLIFSGEFDWLGNLKEFQLENPATKEKKILKLKKAKPHKKGFILTAEGIPDRTEAEKYHGFNFSIPTDLLVSKPGETIYLTEIENFTVQDPNGKTLGQIIGFSTNGAQDLLVVKHEGGQADIPFVDAFLKEIKFEEKIVVMDLPEGLFDLDKA
jgi:16S rRNA processing protein RimM